jgi:PAS domain S-box-containing protein
VFKWFRSGQQRISAHMLVSSVTLAVLTTMAIGVPAIWLIRGQLDRQAWALVSQGSRAAQALISAQINDLNNLAILTAQRPTLQALIQQGDHQALAKYLQTLESGAGLDAIVLCGGEGQQVAQSGMSVSPDICQTPASGSFYLENKAGLDHGWMIASQPVPDESQSLTVIVAQALDPEFAGRLRDQTGLEQVLLLNGRYVTTSFRSGPQAWENIGASFDQIRSTGSNAVSSVTFSLDGDPYIASYNNFPGTDLETISSLSVADLAEAQRQLTLIVGLGILLVTALSSAIGIMRSRQISSPLESLRDSSEKLRSGDLAAPIRIKTNVREVALVAYALEDARIALQHSLAQLRQEKAWVDHLLDSVVEGIVTLDRSLHITYFSRGAERITGWDSERVLGQPVDAVFRLAESDERFSQRIPPPGGKQKILVSLDGGRQVTLAITGAQLAPPEAGRAGSALVLRDVSDEEAIRRLLGEFLANISHEFRTPLSALAASIELLLDQLPDLSPAELHELLDSVHLGVLGLQTLIDNLLEGASIETGRFRVNPHPCELAEIVREAARVMQPLADKYGQRISIDLPEKLSPILADARRTGQVLVNLLSNAIKWGPQDGEVTITVSPAGEQVRVAVADQGPGIPAERQSDLFRRFANLEFHDDRTEHGAGLGLSVTKAIVEAQGGQVGAQNRREHGAVFWFTLPVAPVQEDRETVADESACR